jgi:hypothetical protein
MAYGVKPTRIVLEGWAIPDEVSIDAVYTGDDADWDEAPGVGGEDQWKQPCRAATTASITIATALNAGDTLDGVTLVAGDRVLVKDQGTASENGIYIADASPYRAPDMDEDAEVLGAVVYVMDGTANAGTGWAVTNTAATIVDTDAIDWAAFGGGTTPGTGIDTSLVVVASAGATETVDVSVARTYDITLDADCTFTLSGQAADEAHYVTIIVRQGSPGGFTVTWPAAVMWPGGVTPTIDPVTAAASVYTLFTVDNGTNWFGFPTGGGDLVAALDDLTDVTLAGLASGDVLTYTGAGWENVPPAGSTSTAWMPLSTVVGGTPELVWDADDSLIPTSVPI